MVLFAPAYLRELPRFTGPEPRLSLSKITPAEAAEACRRLANLLDEAPEEVETPGYTVDPATGAIDAWERNGFERLLTFALWGE